MRVLYSWSLSIQLNRFSLSIYTHTHTATIFIFFKLWGSGNAFLPLLSPQIPISPHHHRWCNYKLQLILSRPILQICLSQINKLWSELKKPDGFIMSIRYAWLLVQIYLIVRIYLFSPVFELLHCSSIRYNHSMQILCFLQSWLVAGLGWWRG